LDATPVEFEIVKNQQTAVEVEKTNTKIPNTPEKKPVTPGHSKGETPNKKEKIVETNKNTSKELPSTGDKGSVWLSVSGVMLFIFASTLALLRFKKSK
ncbi:LPXTG cell wall anchor domain-containing protein, partial [uncultured Lactococcus sp.]|uniref:LPXTG cell wall anchor domain-containing protein n=1 Tax=uncultured Lactococcus sp. TaxID=167973 RepID=UPI0027DE3E05